MRRVCPQNTLKILYYAQINQSLVMESAAGNGVYKTSTICYYEKILLESYVSLTKKNITLFPFI